MDISLNLICGLLCSIGIFMLLAAITGGHVNIFSISIDHDLSRWQRVSCAALGLVVLATGAAPFVTTTRVAIQGDEREKANYDRIRRDFSSARYKFDPLDTRAPRPSYADIRSCNVIIRDEFQSKINKIGPYLFNSNQMRDCSVMDFIEEWYFGPTIDVYFPAKPTGG